MYILIDGNSKVVKDYKVLSYELKPVLRRYKTLEEANEGAISQLEHGNGPITVYKALHSYEVPKDLKPVPVKEL